MMMTIFHKRCAVGVGSLLLAGTALSADRPRFSDFTPLVSSAGPTADEAMPITFGNPAFRQRSIADRRTQLADGKPNAGAWDMITLNESGRDKGRFLFTPFEEDPAGIQRHDRRTGETETIWAAPTASSHSSFDPMYWTPWGTLIVAEESWETVATGSRSPYGRLFELKNPIHATSILNPVNPASNVNADFVHHNVIPRTSHEGIQFDRDGHLYFIDELNGGNIYRYTPKARYRGRRSGADYFAAGQTAVLRVGDGNSPNATGAYTWVPFTDWDGVALPGALTMVDSNGTRSVDARNTTNLAAFKGTDYQRPEDAQIQKVRGREYLYIAMTTTNEVYRLDLSRQMITVFASRATLDLSTGLPVGSALASPDNLAVDHDGNIYIVEDRSGGVDDDIWFAKDLNEDGDLNDTGEGLARWASNGTPGSEFSGLYFDPFNKRRAWVNIQHPASGNDRTIEITIAGSDDDDDDDDDEDDKDDEDEDRR